VDIYLYAPATNQNDIILRYHAVPLSGSADGDSSGFGRLTVPLGKVKKAVWLAVPTDEPPVGQSLYENLVDEYGQHDGRIIWARMLLERKGPFAEGAKYDPEKEEVAEKLADAGLHPDAGLVKKPLRDA
jgi:hypothetical protein